MNVERITCQQGKKGDERTCLQKLLGFYAFEVATLRRFPYLRQIGPVLAVTDASRYLTAGKHTLNHEPGRGKEKRVDLTPCKIAPYREHPLLHPCIDVRFCTSKVFVPFVLCSCYNTGIRINASWMFPNRELYPVKQFSTILESPSIECAPVASYILERNLPSWNFNYRRIFLKQNSFIFSSVLFSRICHDSGTCYFRITFLFSWFLDLRTKQFVFEPLRLKRGKRKESFRIIMNENNTNIGDTVDKQLCKSIRKENRALSARLVTIKNHLSTKRKVRQVFDQSCK